MLSRFTCPTCGSTVFEQVVVTLPGGTLRQTDHFCLPVVPDCLLERMIRLEAQLEMLMSAAVIKRIKG